MPKVKGAEAVSEVPAVVRAIWAAAVLVAAAFLAQAIAGPADAAVYVTMFGLVAALAGASCLGRALFHADDRPAWILLAGAMLAFGYTGAAYLADADSTGAFPSTADIGSLGYLLQGCAFVLFARRELSGLPRALWLDAMIGGVALAAVGVFVVRVLFADGASPDTAERGQLLYLAAGLVVAGFVFVAWGLGGFRRSGLLLLGIGAAGQGVADGVFAVQVFDGEFEWPVGLATVWVLAFVIVSARAVIAGSFAQSRRFRPLSLVAVPVTAALIAVAIHSTDSGNNELELWLASAVLVLAVARLAISLIDNQRADERRRREEEARRAREEAERANRAKTAFLSRMSHEVRTPLNSILGFAQLLVDDVDGADRESVERILRAGNHLRQLIDDILDLSSIEAGQTAIRLEPVDLGAVVGEAIVLIEPMARRSNVRIVRRDEANAPETVLADAQRLKQSLLNLLSNAIKYGGSDAEVLVRVERAGERARVSVVDRGPGIPDEDVPKLFTPFERGRARGSGVEGSGIGLALTKNLVDAMGGAIDLDTGPTGSTFRIDLPVCDAPADRRPQAPAADGAVDGDGSCTVLYIEDQDSNVELVARVLARRDDYRLVTATTGREGLEQAIATSPDVVLLDLDLPDIPGEAVLAELRSHPATAGVPVVVGSADATAWRQQELARAGAAAYVVKPLQLGSFLATLDGVLRRPAAAS